MSARSTAALAAETLDKSELLKVESGASNYIAKPIDLDQSLMRVWTHDRRHRKASRASAAL